MNISNQFLEILKHKADLISAKPTFSKEIDNGGRPLKSYVEFTYRIEAPFEKVVEMCKWVILKKN